MKFCPECGSKLVEGAKFCPECGYKILQTEQVVEKVEKYENSEIYIKKMINSIPQQSGGYKISVSPQIGDKQLVNCASTIGKGIDPMIVVALIDTTLFNSGKEGFVFTGKCMYARPPFGEPIKVPFDNIDKAVYEEQEYTDSNNKTTIKKLITISLLDGDYVHISNQQYSDSLPFKTICEILSNINHVVEKIETTEQFLQLKDMGQECISLYLKIIINYLKEDDDIIDPREYKELISLMARLKISKELANELREYRFNDEFEKVENLIEKIKEIIPTGSIQTIFQSLFNDILLTNKEELPTWEDNPLLKKYQKLLGVTDSQATFFIRKCEHDEEIIKNKIEDKAIKNIANELMAVGGAAGISLGALAVTGGIGTGIWGGLFTIAALPTGGMLLGLAAIGGLSYGTYKGVRFLAGTDELEKYAIRSAMLQEKIKEMQLSQSYLIDDINHITEEMKKLLMDKSKMIENHSKLLRYIQMTTNLDNSSKLIYEDQNDKQLSLIKSRLPEILDKEKYDELIKQSPNQKIFNDHVFNFYAINENQQFALNETDDLDGLEKLDQILTQIGYNDTKKSVSAKTNIMAKKGLESLKGLIK